MDMELGSTPRTKGNGDRPGSDADSHESASLLLACHLAVMAEDKSVYETRREALLARITNRQDPVEAIRSAITALATRLPSPRFESRSDLVTALFGCIEDEEAVVSILMSLGGRPELVLPLLHRWVHHGNPFPVLSRVLEATSALDLRRAIEERLADAARQRPDALRSWARERRERFFRPEIFEVLFELAPEALDVTLKEILVDGPEADRKRLLTRLLADGTTKSLRVLALGLTWGEDPRHADVVRALGRFRHPLAVAVLREVVHRANVSGAGLEEARAAMEVLAGFDMEEAIAFLREVSGHRRRGMHVFRREIREIAADLLSSVAAV